MILLQREWAGDVGGGPSRFAAVTAMGSDECRRRTEAAGFHPHLLKPVNPHDLLLVVDELWQVMYAAGGAAPRGE